MIFLTKEESVNSQKVVLEQFGKIKNKYRYLLHATITPNEVKTQLEKTKLQPDQKKRWKIFHWDMIFLSKT